MFKILPNLPPVHQQLIGHRGAAALAPENTLSAFKCAAAQGLNWVEFDIQPCASGEWVVIHDETLNRTTNGQGFVEETTYTEIQKLDAGSWFHPTSQKERIPLLSEVLSCLKDLNLHPNIEIKTLIHPGDKMAKLKSFLLELQTEWPSSLAPPLISSFDWETLILVRSLNPTLPLGYIVDDLSKHEIDRVLEQGFNTLHCHYKKISILDIEYARDCGLPLLAYTVNEMDEIKKCLSVGIASVFSDLTSYKKGN